MKPLHTPLNKSPNKGKRKNPQKKPKCEPKEQNPKVLEKNKLCFIAQTSSKKHLKDAFFSSQTFVL
jgi:hypothetical protein